MEVSMAEENARYYSGFLQVPDEREATDSPASAEILKFDLIFQQRIYIVPKTFVFQPGMHPWSRRQIPLFLAGLLSNEQ